MVGWVEVRKYPEYRGDWEHIIAVKAIYPRNYDMFALLFDVRNGNRVEAIAPNRGIPKDACGHVRFDYKKHDPEGRNKNWTCPSWITLSEIEQVDWSEQGPCIDADFEAIFDMMRVLGKLYGSRNVRLVAWFC